MFPTRKVIPLIPPIPMPAWLFAALYAGSELVLGVTGSQASVAHFAHLGGMIGSAIVIMQWRVRAAPRAPRGYRTAREPANLGAMNPQSAETILSLRSRRALALRLCAPRMRGSRGMGHARHRRHHGHAHHVELWADEGVKADPAIDAVLDEMRHIDESMSTYKPTSEVSQVNAKAADGPMHISKELFDLLVTAKEYSVITDGAFDITYASVGYMYDFRKRVRPSEAQIDKALPASTIGTCCSIPSADRAVLAEGRAHRSRRHRQGLFGGPRHRGAEEVASASRAPTSPRAATAASSAIASASPGSSASAIRARGGTR
jgi:hypothetical protein